MVRSRYTDIAYPLSNLQTRVAALGAEAGEILVRDTWLGRTHEQPRVSTTHGSGSRAGGPRRRPLLQQNLTRLPVMRLDDLFRAERLALAHLDVEGAELDVLRGGRRVLHRDRPVVVVEVHVHARPLETRALLAEVERLGYAAHAIEEVTGKFLDALNLLLLPRERTPAFQQSPTLHVARQHGRLTAVDSESIFDRGHRSCCTWGGECCDSHPRRQSVPRIKPKVQGRPGYDTFPRYMECCKPHVLAAWLIRKHGGYTPWAVVDA